MTYTCLPLIYKYEVNLFLKRKISELTAETVKLLLTLLLPQVFECVISWVNHSLENRQCHLAELMEHVRFPLLPQDYLVQRVEEEPLLKASLKCEYCSIICINKFHQCKLVFWTRDCILFLAITILNIKRMQ